MPDPINIAVSAADSQFTTFIGQVYDDKIWTEGANLYTGTPGYNKNNTNYYVPNATVSISSATYTQTITAQPNGQFQFRVPTSGSPYSITYSAAGYSDTSETGIVITPPGGVTIRVEGRLYPKYGNVSGSIYYDNNLNAVNSEPTDYNHLHEASEPLVTVVTGHPTTASNWTGATFNVEYGYRGLTFGTTSFQRSNARYFIEKVPIGSYQNFKTQDISSSGNWVGVQYANRSFMEQLYTLDGKNPGTVNVSENTTTVNIDFAVMVWGGHIIGTKYAASSGANQEFSLGSYYRTANNVNAKVRGSDYWTALGGSLNSLDGVPGVRSYYLELLDVGAGGGSSGLKRINYQNAQGVIEIKSYPYGSDPDIIIPPGNYVLAIGGDVDLTSEPVMSFSALGGYGNSDLYLLGWSISPTNFPYKYGFRQDAAAPTFGTLTAALAAPNTLLSAGETAVAKDRCANSVFYYKGGAAATNIQIGGGQTHIIQQ